MARARSLLAPSVTVAAGTLVVAWFFATLPWPFGWDQGIFAWVGSVIRDGGMPYRDAVDLKGPLVYYVYAAAQAIFGDNTWGIRVLDAIFMAIAALALRSIVHCFAPAPLGTWAACALILAIGSLGFWSGAQPDGWAGLLITGAVALLLTAPRDEPTPPGRIFIAAVLAGATVLVKPFYAAFALLPLVWIHRHSLLPSGVLRQNDAGAGRQRAMADSALALAGAALPVVSAAAWLSFHGALDDAIDVHLRFTAESYSGIGELALLGRIRGLAEFFSRVPMLLFALPAVGAGVVAAWRSDRAAALMLAGWALMATGFLVLQNRYYLYQIIPALPPLTALAAVGFRSIAVFVGRSAPTVGDGSRTLIGVFTATQLALLLIHLTIGPALDIRHTARYATRAISADAYYRDFAPMLSFNAADERAAIDVLRSRSGPNDRVAILGYNAGILYLADRKSPSRFGPSVPFTHQANSPLTQRFQDEYVEAIARDRPRFIVVGAIDGAPWTLDSRLRSHERLAAIIGEAYCIEEEIGHYVLFSLCRD